MMDETDDSFLNSEGKKSDDLSICFDSFSISSKTITDPKDLNQFIHYCKNEMYLNIVGLMCMPPIDQDPEQHFEMLLDLSQKNNLKYLSMGMTNDYKEALSSRATHLRLGTILFGRR